ncbi:Thiosulfate sulfurtransferase PspE [Acaryochloris thomasi RCC1774]|uniref:Thiosulfate sulfurtransferase PspE n=1 Tax=Acaryochloris thomasi RCC1774 TaxID=1764569 RepID=A0A2W1K1E3_9CYAN|nr:rhodanese-like domain-containing protein [Acaryochloris thomasi]PZD73987.1 Thiosulfate sulfurtransferase PspE [Acaryochloris thomasi RCC1774]
MNRKLLSISLSVLLSVGSVGCNLIPASDEIAPPQLLEQIEAQAAPVILDVRSAREYREGHIPGAINIEFRQLPQRLSELPTATGQTIVVYCETGVRAAVANVTLQNAGYTTILQLDGHMKAWRSKGLPIEQFAS